MLPRSQKIPTGREFPPKRGILFSMDPTKALQDEDLARLARGGSDVAFRVLLKRYEGRLKALVPREPRSQREDLLQEAHLGFLQAVREWDPTAGRSFAATARRAAREAVLAALRHARQDATQHAVSLDLPVRTANEDEPVLPLLEILSVLGTEAVVLARCALRKRLRR